MLPGINLINSGGALCAFIDMPAMEAAMTNGRGVLAMLGDSITAGFNANLVGGVTDMLNRNSTKALAEALTAAGFNVSRDCYNFSGHAYPTDKSSLIAQQAGAMTIGAGWNFGTGINNPWGNGYLYDSGSGDALSVQALLPWDTAEFFYLIYPLNGTFHLDRGGAAQSVSSNGAHDIGCTEFTFPLGTQPLNIKVTGAFSIPWGVRLYNSATPRLVQIDNFGNGGWPTTNAPGGWGYNGDPATPFPGLVKLKAHGFGVLLGPNDKFGGRASGDFQTDLTAIGTKIRSANAPDIGVPPDLVYIIPQVCVGVADFDSTWIACVNAAATANSHRAPINLRTQTVAMSDDTHPTEAGYVTIGDYEASVM